jgi:hypothetical protein
MIHAKICGFFRRIKTTIKTALAGRRVGTLSTVHPLQA